jgi:UDP-3-O-[3-hydroxymyristoyl] glucosamine N-acyltransferase
MARERASRERSDGGVAGPVSAARLAEWVGGSVRGDATRVIRRVSSLENAGPEDLSLLASNRHVHLFRGTRAGVVLAHRKQKLPATTGPTLVLVDDVDAAVGIVLERLAPPISHPPPGIDELARVDATAEVGAGAAIGPFVCIGAHVRIGVNVRLHPGVVIGDDVTIGDDCQLFANVVVRERVSIGNRVIIHAGSVLGSDGFGYRWDGRQHAKVPQIGTVVIEDDVEIGSCVCIDRAKFAETRVGRGTKIDNLVQIAHNVVIGPHCLLVGQVGIAGSAKLGTGVVLGGGAGVRDHVTLGDGVMVAGRAGVASSVPARTQVSGMPALPHRQNLREQAALRRLPELLVQVKKLQEQVARLTRK